MTFNHTANEVVAYRVGKGFFTPNTIDHVRNRDAMLGKLMLVVTEISEAAEAVRDADLIQFREELADAFIRLLDITGTMRIDIESEIARKMRINWDRPVRHGRETSL
jgi:NTP pyrophosphatase (non-canonical NTP hydrolase)